MKIKVVLLFYPLIFLLFAQQCSCQYHDSRSGRVFSGSGIRDLTKIRCRNRENDKYTDGIPDLTVRWEAGFAENWPRDAAFMFVCQLGNSHDPPALAAKANQPGKR